MKYSDDEVRCLVEEYLELRHSSADWVRVRLMDLTRCVWFVPQHQRDAMVCLYVLNMGITELEQTFGVDFSTVYRRAERGLEGLTRHMNRRNHART